MSAAETFHSFAEGVRAHKAEIAGLGMLAVPSVDDMQAHVRAIGDKSPDAVKKRTFLPKIVKPISELAGLGTLAVPAAAALMKHAFFDESVKLGTISAEDARRSMDRLDTLEKNKPTIGQVARYGALGAGAGVLTKAVAHGIEHKKLPGKAGLVASGISGAIGMGAVPLARSMLDRQAERGTLKDFLKEQEKKADGLPDFVNPGGGGGMTTSQYSGPLSMGRFPLVSKAPPFTAPPLTSTFQKKGGMMAQHGLTPPAMLGSAQHIGMPKVTAPSGPSIGDIAKPAGFGTKIPGAVKGSL